MSKIELKPCPFCGSKDITTSFKIRDKYTADFVVVCCNCYTSQSHSIRLEDVYFGKLCDGMGKAVKKWNKRFEGD